jgi:hypothetical protein
LVLGIDTGGAYTDGILLHVEERYTPWMPPGMRVTIAPV